MSEALPNQSSVMNAMTKADGERENSPMITFIGGGNMASALIKGLTQSGFSSSRIWVIEPDEGARHALVNLYSLNCISESEQSKVWHQSEVLVWAVKPQQMKQACEAVSQNAIFSKGPLNQCLHLSVAAGIPCSSLVRWIGSPRVVRAMPNTPALIGLGQTGLYADPQISTQEKKKIEQIIAGTGQYIWLKDESLLNAVTAVSGSGPAYVFYFMQALVEAGVSLGLTKEQSLQLTLGTFQGASQLALQTHDSLLSLRQKVTSKGGTTEAAVDFMIATKLDSLFKDAISKANQRAQDLGASNQEK
jgi:pyrroline-5-carboxylate reductase